jgi:hypothetical protein
MAFGEALRGLAGDSSGCCRNVQEEQVAALLAGVVDGLRDEPS